MIEDDGNNPGTAGTHTPQPKDPRAAWTPKRIAWYLVAAFIVAVLIGLAGVY